MTAPILSAGPGTGAGTGAGTGTGDAPVAPWLLAHATACAEAVASAFDLLDTDEVETEPDPGGPGFVLHVHADPPRALRALRWTPETGWEATGDSARRRTPRWSPLPLPADADPLLLCEVLRAGR